MRFWEGGAPLTLILIAVLLSVAGTMRSALPGLGRLRLPDSMVAGFVGLALGPSFLAVLPIDQGVLERVVYHGLALLFITVSLRTPAQAGATSSGVRGVAFALPMLVMVQAALGLGLGFLWSALVQPLHPGVGLMVPLGFSQGPGQALALGSAWEANGMEDGAQLGLIMAEMGFVFCVGLGAPLLALARRMGWLVPVEEGEDATGGDPVPDAKPGDMEPLTRQIAAVAVVYLGAWGLIQGLAWGLAGNPQAVATVYGFHFVLGAVLALGLRKALGTLGRGEVLHTPLLSRMAAVVVDVVTVSAIAAVQVAVIQQWWAVVLVFAAVGGSVTAALSVWVARRAFPDASFEYALVLFGAATGTLATGLALLRLTDPELKGPVASGAVLGAAASLPASLPLLLLLQVPVTGWPDTHPGASWTALGAVLAYGAVLALLWWWFGGLRLLRPLSSFWPARS